MTFTEDEIEAARIVFAGPIAFERGVADFAQLPEADVAEIAFAGRSNVGKSSLINAIAGRRIARASNEPGRTRELNYFRVGERLRLVDLPGYGYARAPKSAIARWTGLMRDFLRGRAGLKRVMLLIDSRHGLKPNDGEIMDALDEAAVSYQIALTKIDKISASALAAVTTATEAAIAKRAAAHPQVLSTSAESGTGIALIRAELCALA